MGMHRFGWSEDAVSILFFGALKGAGNIHPPDWFGSNLNPLRNADIRRHAMTKTSLAYTRGGASAAPSRQWRLG